MARTSALRKRAPEDAIGAELADRRGRPAIALSAGDKRLSWRDELPAYLLLLGLAVLWLAGRASGVTLPTDCGALPGALVFGIDTQVTMTAKSGALCPLSMRIAEASIDDLEIVSAPTNGTAITDRRKAAIYRANQNFRGQDSFAVAMRGRSPLFTGTSVVRVNVTVR